MKPAAKCANCNNMLMLLSVVSLMLIDTVDVTSAQGGTLGFYLNGFICRNGSTILINQIGEDENALYCTTNNTDCCDLESDVQQRPGKYYFPDGTEVTGRKSDYAQLKGYFRTRGYQFIRLNRFACGTVTGKFRCEIPDASGESVTLFVNIVSIPMLDPVLTLVSNRANPIMAGGDATTLTCAVEFNQETCIPINITTSWTSPNGSSLTSQPMNMMTSKKNDSTVRLDSLRSTDSGEYKSIVKIHGESMNTAQSIHLTIGDLEFQLKIKGIDICQQWRKNAVQYMEHIESALIQGIRDECECHFTSQNLLNGYFICNTRNTVTYRNTFIETNSIDTSQFNTSIFLWIRKNPWIKVSSYRRHSEMMFVDRNCPHITPRAYDDYGDANYIEDGC